MTGGRLVHRATDGLPESAWNLLVSGFRARKAYRAISQELAKLGFNVPERTVARRAADWRTEQFRREALRVAAIEAPRTDWLEEVIGILEILDVRSGWMLRGKRRVQKAVLGFLDEASMENAQTVKRELLRFRLETVVWQQRGAGAGLELGQPNTNKAGEAGGGHDGIQQ